MADEQRQPLPEDEKGHTVHSKQFDLMLKRKQILRHLAQVDEEGNNEMLHQISQRAHALYEAAMQEEDMTPNERQVLIMS